MKAWGARLGAGSPHQRTPGEAFDLLITIGSAACLEGLLLTHGTGWTTKAGPILMPCEICGGLEHVVNYSH
jgi:hypothetical protein